MLNKLQTETTPCMPVKKCNQSYRNNNIIIIIIDLTDALSQINTSCGTNTLPHRLSSY